MGFAADLIAASIAVGVIGSRLVRYRRLRLDPTLLFTVGHLYYLSGAAIMYRFRLLADFQNVYAIIDRVPPDRLELFSWWSLGFLVSFLAGSWLARMVPTRRHPERIGPADLRIPGWAILIGAFGLFVVTVVAFRATILGGYRSGDVADIQTGPGRGTVSAAATAVALSVLFVRHQAWKANRTRPWKPVDEVPYLMALMPVLLLLLVAGGRLYATTFVVALAVWASITLGGVRRSVLVGGAAAGVLFLSAFGSLRQAQVPTANDLAVYATAESVLVSISPAIYLTGPEDTVDALRAPVYLQTDIINAVPRVILPNKDDLLRSPEDDGYTVESSLGGVSVGSSMLVNFGWLGSLVVTAGLGWVFSRLWVRAVNNPTGLLPVGLAVAVGSLPMSFYRDKFSVSIVRWMFVSAVVQTVLSVVIARVVARPTRPRRAATDGRLRGLPAR